MNPPDQTALEKIHRFLDEAGDTTFFGKSRVPMLGQDGVSLSFGLGMVKFAAPIAEMREQVVHLCRAVEADVVDLYDAEKYEGSRNYYTPKCPLTAENKLGPPVS
jgi:hypothetical protein